MSHMRWTAIWTFHLKCHMVWLNVILLYYRITCLWLCNKRFCNKKGHYLCQTPYVLGPFNSPLCIAQKYNCLKVQWAQSLSSLMGRWCGKGWTHPRPDGSGSLPTWCCHSCVIHMGQRHMFLGNNGWILACLAGSFYPMWKPWWSKKSLHFAVSQT